ncbi:MAG: glycosyltransferase [Alphaproteobacteria bacterium]|nr:glycosyltransferase [Alphaproteobacteria bacterium]
MSSRLAVVIPCFNAAPWIAKTIGSVLDQDHPDTHVIVVDDGSTDGSVAAVQAFGDRVTLLTGPNRGACHARNAGQAIAVDRGADYVVFLDADDYFEGEILGAAVGLARAKGADMVLSDMHLEYDDGRRDLRHRYTGQIASETFFTGWMSGDYVNPSGILWRTGFVTEVGGWDESLARAQDLEFTLRALLSRPLIWKNDTGAAIHARINPNSITRNQSLRALDSRFRANAGLVDKARGTSFAPAIPLICQEIYFVARAAFKAGETELGRRALAFTRAQGYRDHPGTPSHRLIAGILGLETKVRLWKR